MLTSAGIIAAKVVKVDAANDLALLPPAWRAKAPLRRGGGKAEGQFAALPVVANPS